MILFKPYYIEPILAGRKTQTRRLGEKRWNVGATHQLRTRMLDKGSTFAVARIVQVRRQLLFDTTAEEAYAEGYDSVPDFIAEFARINKSVTRDLEVWVVEFRVIHAVPSTVLQETVRRNIAKEMA